MGVPSASIPVVPGLERTAAKEGTRQSLRQGEWEGAFSMGCNERPGTVCVESNQCTRREGIMRTFGAKPNFCEPPVTEGISCML